MAGTHPILHRLHCFHFNDDLVCNNNCALKADTPFLACGYDNLALYLYAVRCVGFAHHRKCTDPRRHTSLCERELRSGLHGRCAILYVYK